MNQDSTRETTVTVVSDPSATATDTVAQPAKYQPRIPRSLRRKWARAIVKSARKERGDVKIKNRNYK